MAVTAASGSAQNPTPQQVGVGTPEHRALHQLQPVHLALDLAA